MNAVVWSGVCRTITFATAGKAKRYRQRCYSARKLDQERARGLDRSDAHWGKSAYDQLAFEVNDCTLTIKKDDSVVIRRDYDASGALVYDSTAGQPQPAAEAQQPTVAFVDDIDWLKGPLDLG